MVTFQLKLLTRHLQDQLYFIPTPLINIVPDKLATTSADTNRESINELLISSDSIKLTNIFPLKSIDTTSTSPTTYPSYIISPLFAPSTPPSGFYPILPPYLTFETPSVVHTSIPSDSSPITLPTWEPNTAPSSEPSDSTSGDLYSILPKKTS